jgi:hypothetical protein
MKIVWLAFVLITFAFTNVCDAQQTYALPDVKSMKHLTSKPSKRGGDQGGGTTIMDFYSAQDGSIVTIYTYRGRPVVFSTHRNEDLQKTYRLFMDQTGAGGFQEIPRGTQWTIPAWAR